MARKNLLGNKHSGVSRDYISRVTDPEFPKSVAASIAKEWGADYWDGDRRVGYGGYEFRPGFWTPVAESLISEYGLTSDSRILDVGCGKGFLLAELKSLVPGIQIAGLDISQYAIERAHPSVRSSIVLGDCVDLPFNADEFDLVISINVLHNLTAPRLILALEELSRVAKRGYVVVESYETEAQKENLLYWQLTCESFFRPEEWIWAFELAKYKGDFEFIFFD
jgi:protein-L-isoaspartate(D-aspartate) O-methyltransferase